MVRKFLQESLTISRGKFEDLHRKILTIFVRKFDSFCKKNLTIFVGKLLNFWKKYTLRPKGSNLGPQEQTNDKKSLQNVNGRMKQNRIDYCMKICDEID